VVTLTSDQVDFFRQDGYLPIGGLLEDSELNVLREAYDSEFESAKLSGEFRNLAGTDATAYDADDRMLQIMQMCERSIQFRKLLFDSRILDVVTDLIGPNIMLFHDQALWKPAQTGGPVHWHQDNAYWRCSPANLISCWITLDYVDDLNGAMNIIPGSHLKPTSHEHASDTDRLLITPVDASNAVVVDLPAGGCMFHHCLTLHHTKPNRTPRNRRAFAIHFMTPGTRDSNDESMHVSFARPMLRSSF
jgi:phytanoyl-CoA hydroxylase